MPEGSLVCLKCGKILTEDETAIKKLRYLQNMAKAQQEKARSLIPDELSGNIGDDEYVYSVVSLGKAGWFRKPECWLITEKKLVKYANGQLLEIPVQDIASINIMRPQEDPLLGGLNCGFFVQTYDLKQLVFAQWQKFPFALEQLIDTLEEFHMQIETARFLCEHKVRDIHASLWQLNLH